MTLVIVRGSIFSHEYSSVSRVIAHGCNSKGVMGSGVAKAVRDRYPKAYSDYRTRYLTLGLALGDIVISPISSKLLIANCITQGSYGRDTNVVYVDYEAVRLSLAKVSEITGYDEIHLPFIGGGLANGDRNLLLDIYEDVFKNSNAKLYIKV